MVGPDPLRLDVAQGGVRAANALPDALGCGTVSGQVIRLHGLLGDTASIDFVFAGSLVLYGALGRIGEPLVLEVDGMLLKAVDNKTDNPPRCAVLATWPLSGQTIDGVFHTFRATYTGTHAQQYFILNATVLHDVSDPTDLNLMVSRPRHKRAASESTSSVFSSTSTTADSPAYIIGTPIESSGGGLAPNTVYTIVAVTVIGGVCLAIALSVFYCRWKHRRALSAPSTAFRADVLRASIVKPTTAESLP